MSSATLARQQREFMAQLLDDERALPKNWNARHAAGMLIYRNAYRSRLVDALRSTYERSARWVGEDAFRQAAAHHVITHPPRRWTLDDAGVGFPETLRQLFPQDPEVSELAWLEWAMHRCFVAADARPMDVAGFAEATESFREQDWVTLRLTFLPGFSLAPISHDIGKLWRALAEERTEIPRYATSAPLYSIVWREGLKPVFMQVHEAEGQALSLLLGGASYGEVCNELIALLGEADGVAQAGSMLGRWLHQGMIASVSR